MHTFLRYFAKLPAWKGRPPMAYIVPFSLDRLTDPAGNSPLDVRVSPYFCQAVAGIVSRFLFRNTAAADLLPEDQPVHWTKDRDEFKRLCLELLVRATEKARANGNETQIDYLARTALVKVLLLTIRSRFDHLLARLSDALWEKESSSRQDLMEIARLKEKTAAIRQGRKRIIYATTRQLLQYLQELQERDLDRNRQRYFGRDMILPPEFFSNPILFHGSRLEDSLDDFVMVTEYVLLGRRAGDPNNHQAVLSLLIELLSGIEVEALQDAEQQEPGPTEESEKPDRSPPQGTAQTDEDRDGWLKQVETIDTLFNCFETEKQFDTMRTDPRTDKGVLRALKEKAAEQEKFLDHAFLQFEENGLISFIVATFLVRDIHVQCCPPLVPQQVLQFLVNSRVRPDIEDQVRRMEKVNGQPQSLKVLRKAARGLAVMKDSQKKRYLLEFLKGFSRYHRDLSNFAILRAAMERINLLADASMSTHGRASHQVYEFLLSHEEVLVPDQGSASGHAVVRGRLREVTKIIERLASKGIDPSSYFAKHLFDPISTLVSEYGAVKVAGSGDVITLALLGIGRQKAADFGMARACGLAISLLIVQRRFNAENIKHGLPRLDIGIGIGFEATAPSYLADGDHQMMMSEALVAAEQMSVCSDHPRRVLLGPSTRPFNIHVCQAGHDGNIEESALLRFNVNGIGLSTLGFRQLAREIDLLPLNPDLPECLEEGGRLYAGRSPAIGGHYQNLIIREATVAMVDSTGLHHLGLTERKYYEVVTYPALFSALGKKS